MSIVRLLTTEEIMNAGAEFFIRKMEENPGADPMEYIAEFCGIYATCIEEYFYLTEIFTDFIENL